MKATLIALSAVVLSSVLASAGDETKPAPAAAKAMKMDGKVGMKQHKGPIAIGDAAPMTDVKMEGVDGKSITIADVKGEKGTLVIFSCNHCPVAKAYESRIVEIGNEWKKKGFGVVVINSNDPSTEPVDGLDEMKTRAKDGGYEFPYVVDATSDVARAFGASKTPEVFLFDKELKLAYYGAVDSDQQDAKGATPYLKNALAALADGKKIETPTTKALGCGIKFRAKKTAEKANG